LFLDEGGNLDFSTTGTKYFTMTSVLSFRPFALDDAMESLRYDLIESGINKEYFHATEDEQSTRDAVYDLIAPMASQFHVHSIIVEKRKTGPSLRADDRFYPEILKHLLKYVARCPDAGNWKNLIVITDRLPVQKKRQAVEKAIRRALVNRMPDRLPYRILHHDSKSCCGLQIADYFNWAIYRRWDRDDRRSYDRIKNAIRSEFEIFRLGHTNWY
jgi:hypothetical protein